MHRTTFSPSRWETAVRVGVAVASCSLLALPAWSSNDLIELSLEELMNIEVTSVSKRAERKADTAAAITVITAEDIRRSGMTSVPDRRTQRLYPLLWRDLLGRPGLPVRGHRADRGHPRSGRHGLGRERGQRRHQHHHQECERDPRRADLRAWRHAGLWRHAALRQLRRREARLPRLRPRLQRLRLRHDEPLFGP